MIKAVPSSLYLSTFHNQSVLKTVCYFQKSFVPEKLKKATDSSFIYQLPAGKILLSHCLFYNLSKKSLLFI